jgi:hypothetical protein
MQKNRLFGGYIATFITAARKDEGQLVTLAKSRI